MQPTPIKPAISGENPVHTTIGSEAVLAHRATEDMGVWILSLLEDRPAC